MRQESSGIQISETDDGFVFMEDEENVLSYQRQPKSLDGKYERSHYVHPLYDLDGDVLTEDFPPDHPHQRGIFWAWHQVWVGDLRVGDAWILENFLWDVQEARVFAVDTLSSALEVRVLWKSPLWTDGEGRQKALVKETSIIRVHRASDNIRKVDFQIGLIALEEGVRIGGSEDAKGYGGFSPRIRLPEDLTFTGREGEVEPLVGPVHAGPWLDVSGHFQEQAQVSGVAILCHPSLPGFPQPWILRRSRSMQNPVYPGPKPIPLSHEDQLVLRYRLVIHRGSAHEAKIEQLQTEYDAEEPLEFSV